MEPKWLELAPAWAREMFALLLERVDQHYASIGRQLLKISVAVEKISEDVAIPQGDMSALQADIKTLRDLAETEEEEP